MSFAPPDRPLDIPTSSISSISSRTVAEWLRTHWRMTASGIGLLVAGIVLGIIGTRQFATDSAPADKSSIQAGEKESRPSDSTVKFTAERQAVAGIEVTTVTPEPFVASVWRTGRVTLNEERLAHICPPAEGVIREVPVRLGQTVAAGDVLAVIDSRELGQAKLDAYRAKIALAAEQELASRTRTTMNNAEELLSLLAANKPLVEIEKQMADKPIGDWRQQLLGAYTRRNQLRSLLASQQSSSGALSEASIRKTESESDAAAAAYTALVEEMRFQAKNQVRQAELKLKDAETAFDVAKAKLLLFGQPVESLTRLDPISEGATASYLAIKAPFAGTVVEKHAVRSERVGPQSQMFVLADLSTLWVQADLFEADLPLVRELTDPKIEFRSLMARIRERSATILYSGDLIDKASRSLTLTAEAANSDRLLKPGMFVEVKFETHDRNPTIQIENSAVLWHENKPFVFRQIADDTFQRTPITLGRTGGKRMEVTAGLKTGDRVVIRGGFVLKSELLKDQMVGE